jgi:hypothetical protein
MTNAAALTDDAKPQRRSLDAFPLRQPNVSTCLALLYHLQRFTTRNALLSLSLNRPLVGSLGSGRAFSYPLAQLEPAACQRSPNRIRGATDQRTDRKNDMHDTVCSICPGRSWIVVRNRTAQHRRIHE